jgi:SprT-like family
MIPFRKFILTEDHINFGDYNLQAKFHHYNQLLFQNQIPPCPIMWAELKGQAGLTTFTKQTSRTILPGSMKIEISNKFKRSEQELDSTVIHEMIHAFLATHGHPDENHGLYFQTLATKCGEKVGIHISLTDQLMDMELAHEDRVMTTALLRSKKDGSYSAVFYSGTAFDEPKKQDQLKAFWGAPGRITQGEEIFVVKLMTGLMGKYGRKTEIAQANWSIISASEARDIFQHGQIMFKIQPDSISHEEAINMQPAKDMLCVFRTNTRTGDVFGSFYQPNMVKDHVKMQKLKDYWEGLFRSGYNVEIFTTKSVNYSRFVMMREPKGTFYNLKPPTVAEMRRNAHYLVQWIQ